MDTYYTKFSCKVANTVKKAAGILENLAINSVNCYMASFICLHFLLCVGWLAK